jgi:chorismate synthase
MMSSNKLSSILGISTFGESHGPAVGILFDSPIPNKELPLEEIRAVLKLRAPKGLYSTARIEPDDIEILSGVFEGKTTGAPLCIIIRNQAARSRDYEAIKDLIRPGYADYAWLKKYHIFDYRGGGRASGRETVARVIAAELVRTYIPEIKILVSTLQIGEMSSAPGKTAPENTFHWPDADSYTDLLAYVESIRAAGDSIGGIIRVTAENVPAGLGDPIYDKLSANIAKAMLSIGSVRGIMFGDGLELAKKPGSWCNDQFKAGRLQSNHHGGILGGVSTGEELCFDLIIRPVSGISIEQDTIDHDGTDRKISISGRHDSCHIPRLIPVVEAMLTICLADAVQYQKLISRNQDLAGYREALNKLDEDLIMLLKRRKEVVKHVKLYKATHDLHPKDPEREREIAHKVRALAQELDLDVDLVDELMKLNLRISAI